jgi:hypothetical protein
MEKINFFITLFIRITLILTFLLSILERNFLFIFLSLITFVLTFLPKFIEKKYKINIPSQFEIIIVLFIYAGVFLGGVKNFYYKYWWWDSLLHFISGLALGFIGFLILYILYRTEKFKAKPFVIVFFAFCFAIMVGVIWEIFEFLVDSFFGYNMQKARNLSLSFFCNTRLGVIDTMIDLILNVLGALIASISGYFYLVKKRSFLFKKLVNIFKKENKEIFRKK